MGREDETRGSLRKCRGEAAVVVCETLDVASTLSALRNELGE
jgi:hypothetical protein